MINPVFLLLLFFSLSLQAKIELKSFYPLHKTSGKIGKMISLYNPKIISEKVVDEVNLEIQKNAVKDKKDALRLPLSKALSKKLLKMLNIKTSMNIYIYNFVTNSAQTIPWPQVKELYVDPNPAGEIGLGTFGLLIPNINAKEGSSIAYIGDESPFLKKGSMKKVKWIDSDIDVFNYRAEEDEEIEARSDKYIFLGTGLKLYHSKAFIKMEKNYTEERFGIFVKNNDGSTKKIEGRGSYSYPPSEIWVGKMLKDFGNTFISTTTGMENCGHFFVLDQKKFISLLLSCGSWAC